MVVYPRWRGELVLTDKTVLRFVGLSPLARGTRMIPNLGYRTSRFIPAGAGNSDLKIASQYWRAVYPRWRGELMKCRNVNFSSGGLSPLARGTRDKSARIGGPLRFIPAGAGNSKAIRRAFSCQPVYPRWRGELPQRTHESQCSGGLSPLARGTPLDEDGPGELVRFIPAGAGNSAIRWIHCFVAPVYPRWRGELNNSRKCSAALRGLSPLARGTPSCTTIAPSYPRFIPAGAGNSSPIGMATCDASVYPRWRGELQKTPRFLHFIGGLSPLARGTL